MSKSLQDPDLLSEVLPHLPKPLYWARLLVCSQPGQKLFYRSDPTGHLGVLEEEVAQPVGWAVCLPSGHTDPPVHQLEQADFVGGRFKFRNSRLTTGEPSLIPHHTLEGVQTPELLYFLWFARCFQIHFPTPNPCATKV